MLFQNTVETPLPATSQQRPIVLVLAYSTYIHSYFKSLSNENGHSNSSQLPYSQFPYFKLVTLKTLVILCNTLKKEGRASRNIGKKYIPILCNKPC